MGIEPTTDFTVTLCTHALRLSSIIIMYLENKLNYIQLQDEAGINSIELEVLPPYSEIAQIALPGAPYFHAEMPSGDQIMAKTRQHFPLQFGR